MKFIIDPPDIDDDFAEWQQFLDEMEAARERARDPGDIEQIEFWIRRAKDILSREPTDSRQAQHGSQ